MNIRALPVDDQEMVRMGFRMVLDTAEGIEIADEAFNGGEVLDVLVEHPADVVLMDMCMPRIDGTKATRRVTTLEGPPHVLVLTTFDLDEYAYEALRAGASGFLLKNAPLEEVAVAVHHVHDGDAVVMPSTTCRLLDHFAAPEASSPVTPTSTVPPELLTPRECEVLSLITYGLSNREIADELILSGGAVKAHVGHVLTKFDLHDYVQAVILTHETDLIAPESA